MTWRRYLGLRGISKACKFCTWIILGGNVFLLMLILLTFGTDKENHVIKGKYHDDEASLKKIQSNHNYDIKHFVLLGNLQPLKEVLLTIGIVSVDRPGEESYLHSTLQSVLAVSSYEKENLRVLIFFPTASSSVLDYIAQNYTKHLECGLLVVLGPIPDFYYPSFHNLPRSYNDPPERIVWRAKQNLDYAFLWRMAVQTKAQYFLQLEDDVTSTQNYFSKLMNFVNEHKNVGNWALMEFSRLGFIGKLFKMEDLNKMASLAYHFSAQQPVDYLLMVFRQIMNQKEPIVSVSLFQHIGKVSSLKGKKQLLVDEHFEAKDMNADNPPVSIETSMKGEFSVVNAYKRDDSYFWYDKPTTGDWILLTFDEAQNIETLHIKTGNVAHPQDFLHSARVTFSTDSLDCASYTYAGVFVDGVFEMRNQKSVKCVKVTISAPQDTWLLVRDIAVHTQTPK